MIEEGSASGVTTSLGGEQPDSVPLTATNVDTTTDLTILPGSPETAGTAPDAPGSLAETLEIDPAAPPRRAPPGGYRPSSPASRPDPALWARETTPTETAEPAPDRPAEKPEASPAPTTTAPAEEPPPPPPTTTSTQPM
ncbi:MAG TPA: hypothetical protein VLV48_05395 [Thermoanaerobaculia bacterium]|nr:hypothetical protein [Thermoanaerobaculia bacterium]